MMSISSSHMSDAAWSYAGLTLAFAAKVLLTGGNAFRTSGARSRTSRFVRTGLRRLSVERGQPEGPRPAPLGEHDLSYTEAAALADAGLMPLEHYLDLAERNGWMSDKT